MGISNYLLLITVAACTTVLFLITLKPASAGAFAVWLVLPYVIMGAALTLLQRKGKTYFLWYAGAAIVSIGGVLFLADVIFWHPDAQGAIAVFMTPIFQCAALVVLVPVVRWASRNKRD